jgi:hypothetical protein
MVLAVCVVTAASTSALCAVTGLRTTGCLPERSSVWLSSSACAASWNSGGSIRVGRGSHGSATGTATVVRTPYEDSAASARTGSGSRSRIPWRTVDTASARISCSRCDCGSSRPGTGPVTSSTVLRGPAVVTAWRSP